MLFESYKPCMFDLYQKSVEITKVILCRQLCAPVLELV